MSVAVERRAPRRSGARLAWPAALLGLFFAALALRLVGLRTGLPYVYNADENSHFVPRAVGMFGHGLNPHYFVNPPAYTYLLHGLFVLRYGLDPASIGGVYGSDPTGAYTLARAASAVLGALAVVFTAIAGRRLFDDKRVGVLAGALLAVAFLPVHYSHFALNDAPTLAPLSLCLVGVAGIYRTGRLREYVLAGAALGLAIATKYPAGIAVLAIIAAAVVSPVAHARVRNLAIAGGLIVIAFLVFNPYAWLDRHTFWTDGIRKQTQTASEEGGKLGLAHTSGWWYYLTTLTWGFGWLPSLAALGGLGALIARNRRLALILAPAPILLFLYLGNQSRFFARWMLPAYPMLCLLAAYGIVALATRVRPRVLLPALGALVALQGVVFSVHNDVVLARADTRMLAREWMAQHIPIGTKIVMEPIAPTQWAWDTGHPLFGKPPHGTGSGSRWNKYPTSRSCFLNGQLRETGGVECPVIKLEDYERTTRPALLDSYVKGGFCWVVTGSTQYGRAYADPKVVPDAVAYYEALKRRGREVFHLSPYGDAHHGFSFDYSFNYYPLEYDHPGPEIAIYKLCDTSTQ